MTVNTNNTTTIEVSISAINLDIKTYQVRENGIKDEQVEALVNSDVSTWQPVVLKSIENSLYAVVSGFHRVHAAIEKKLDTIKAYVIPANVSHNDTILLAYQYNSEHGLPLTMGEKKKYAVLVHLQQPELPAYKIAMIAHISDKTVTQAILDYENEQATANQPEQTEATELEKEPKASTASVDDKFNKFSKSLRKFYQDVISDIASDEEVASYFVRFMVNPPTDEMDSDLDILKTYHNALGHAIKRLTPKPVKPAKQAQPEQAPKQIQAQPEQAPKQVQAQPEQAPKPASKKAPAKTKQA